MPFFSTELVDGIFKHSGSIRVLPKLLLVIWACVFMIRDGGEDGDSQGDGSSQPDTISIASRTSQNTVDSDKVRKQVHLFES